VVKFAVNKDKSLKSTVKGVPMKVLTSTQMKKIDRTAIEEIGILGTILMENAGKQIFKRLREKFPELSKEKIVIVAGKGNNGGDGFVVARLLHNHGAAPHVLLLASKEQVRGDAAVNLKKAEKIGIKISEVCSPKDWKLQKEKIFHSSVLVDAIFGTGLVKPAQGLYVAVIKDINKSKAYKIAVDIPSGLSSDTFQIIGPCVRADLTVTLAAPKVSHVFPPAEEYVGELIVADIGVPSSLFDDENLKLELVERKTVLPYFRRRSKDTHKGTYGHLFIISGSLGKTGAAVMAGKAALKMGAGLVTVGTPESCLPIVARSMDELMTEPLPETQEKTISHEALKKVLSLLKGKDALMIGPGISTHKSTSELVLSLMPKINVPSVVDADALNILASKPETIKSLRQPAVLTPHPGEFARLLNLSTREVVERKLELAPQFAEEYGVYLVLKAYRTITATPDGKVFINPTGNPGMATAGSGDVLSGMIASMIVQEKNLLEAVLAAVYVHGLSGDIGAEKLGEKALTAGDIIRYLPSGLRLLESE
jgi:NAD(P)H-hydrate epimerase